MFPSLLYLQTPRTVPGIQKQSHKHLLNERISIKITNVYGLLLVIPHLDLFHNYLLAYRQMPDVQGTSLQHCYNNEKTETSQQRTG